MVIIEDLPFTLKYYMSSQGYPLLVVIIIMYVHDTKVCGVSNNSSLS
jgi:uncharacterized membrane protein